MSVEIQSIDHIVMTVEDVATTCAFYQKVLCMEAITFKGDRKALKFGQQKINLHQYQAEYKPHAKVPQPGSQDFCLISNTPMTELVAHMQNNGITIEQGPVERTGATGGILSIYIRDPDNNLVEIANLI